jgi:xanthine/uracil permease
MTTNQKRAIVMLFGGIGVLVMLVGALTDLYSFIPEGLIGGVAAWILSAVLNQLFGGRPEL